MTAMRHTLTLLVILIAVVLGDLAVWALPNRPVAVDPPPGGKLRSMSFAPYRDGQSALTKVVLGRDQIDEDLRLISQQVAGIRTYSSLDGMEAVPELARKYGLTVTMGAWLDAKLSNNELEVASLIRLANQYPDVIKRVIVGNEVLLRNELTPGQLASYLQRVRQAIKQPVSYADVWEFWLANPKIFSSVDYVTIHLLPYWEDVPTSVEGAIERVLSAYNQISLRFPGKPILVGEVGWPTAGRTRGEAVPGLVNQARFNSTFIRVAAFHGFDYNLIEAFDQNWKIKLEGTVGGKWGLYTASRQAKYSVAEPVVEDAAWPVKAGFTALLAMAIMVQVLRRRPDLSGAGVAVMTLFGFCIAVAWVRAADIAWNWHAYSQDIALALAMLGLQALVAWAILAEVLRLWAEPAVLLDAEAPEPAAGAGLALSGRVAMIVLAALSVLWTGLEIFDGRYRDFPVAAYLIPAAGVLALALCRLWRRPAGCDREAALSASHLFGSFAEPAPDQRLRRSVIETILTVPLSTAFAVILPAGAIGLLYAEDPFSREAAVWAALQVALAVPYMATVVATRRGTEPRAALRQL